MTKWPGDPGWSQSLPPNTPGRGMDRKSPWAHLPPPPDLPVSVDPEPDNQTRAVTALIAPNGTDTIVLTAGFGNGSHHTTIHSWPPDPVAMRAWVFDGPTGHITLPWAPQRILLKLTTPTARGTTPTGWESGWVTVRNPHSKLELESSSMRAQGDG